MWCVTWRASDCYGLDIYTRKFKYVDLFGENFLVVLLVAMLCMICGRHALTLRTLKWREWQIVVIVSLYRRLSKYIAYIHRSSIAFRYNLNVSNFIRLETACLQEVSSVAVECCVDARAGWDLTCSICILANNVMLYWCSLLSPLTCSGTIHVQPLKKCNAGLRQM
jgi:hypothetical protein